MGAEGVSGGLSEPTHEQLAGLSVPELVELAREREGESGYDRWLPIGELHRRGDDETFDAAEALSRNPQSRERVLGAKILGQLGYLTPSAAPVARLRERAMKRLVELSHDPSTDVVAAAIHALGSHGDPSALDAVLAWTDSPEWSIRASVARAFPGITGRLQPYALPPDHARRVIEALMALAEDESGDVRERALFAIGGRYEVDTPELRDLLARHLDDPHDGAAEQAIFALARRRDEQAFPALVRVLTPERATRLFIESAAHLADERLLPALQGLTATWPGYETPLLDALRACDPAERARWEIYGAALAGELEARLRDLMADRLFVVEVGREPFEYVPQLTAGWSSIGGAGVTLSYDLTALVDTRLGGNLASAGEIFNRDIIEADLAAD